MVRRTDLLTVKAWLFDVDPANGSTSRHGTKMGDRSRSGLGSAGRYWIRKVLAVQRLTLRWNRKYVRNCASQIDCGVVVVTKQPYGPQVISLGLVTEPRQLQTSRICSNRSGHIEALPKAPHSAAKSGEQQPFLSCHSAGVTTGLAACSEDAKGREELPRSGLLELYAFKPIAIVIEQSEGGFSAYVPDLPGCVAAAETMVELEELIREAISFHLEGLREDGGLVPPASSRVEYVEVAA